MQPACTNCHRRGDQATYYCTTSDQKTQHPVCREYFVSGLKREHVFSISKKTGEDIGGPFELYSAILDDNTEVVVKKAFHTSCKYLVPYKQSYMSNSINNSYFDVVKNLFQQMSKNK